MIKYRIIEEFSSSNSTTKSTFSIQLKSPIFGWKTIKRREGVFSSTITFDSYSDAERYLKAQYFPHGHVVKFNNEYHYTPTSYAL